MITWRDRLRLNPFGTMAALAALVLGALGAALGDDVSEGMRNSLSHSADVVAHLWGIAFATGGVLTLWGLYRHRSEVELPGLWLLIGGYTFYSITVLTGLGQAGLAAGTISAAMAIGCALKAVTVMEQARRVAGGGEH